MHWTAPANFFSTLSGSKEFSPRVGIEPDSGPAALQEPLSPRGGPLANVNLSPRSTGVPGETLSGLSPRGAEKGGVAEAGSTATISTARKGLDETQGSSPVREATQSSGQQSVGGNGGGASVVTVTTKSSTSSGRRVRGRALGLGVEVDD